MGQISEAGFIPEITRRERDVLRALCGPAASTELFVEPASVREMAQSLDVTDAAVKQHLLNLYDKFGIGEGERRRRVALAREVVRRGVVDLPERRPTATAGGRQTRNLAR